ncbi:MAG TPA: translation elongation factor Ts, partial [Candidatus Dormibacteraeota bacterium]|nr:translation elongation factor Ts [Candidatus Dormibacteraeota bacterium]
MAKVKEIPAKLVAELRARTGAGMMDCKKALEETEGDLDQAVDVLRKKGAAKADKRAERVAAEGLIGSYVHHNGKLGVIVELTCETDFVARTPEFQTLARDLAMHIASANPLAVKIEDLSAELVAHERKVYEA